MDLHTYKWDQELGRSGKTTGIQRHERMRLVLALWSLCDETPQERADDDERSIQMGVLRKQKKCRLLGWRGCFSSLVHPLRLCC